MFNLKKISLFFLMIILTFSFPKYIFAESIIKYSTHVQSYGWMEDVADGKISGTVGEGKRLEAYKIEKISSTLTGDIYYKTYVEGIGWQDYVSSGDTSGTVGQSKRIEMVQMKLTDELSEQYDLYYRVHVAHIGWMDWASNNQVTGTLGYDYQIEAIQIQLVKKGEETPNSTKDIYREKPLQLWYSSHSESHGWMEDVADGKISGTVGEGKRLEAYKIEKVISSLTGDIYYKTYVEGIGWQDYVSSGDTSGTVGQSKRIEMVQMKLTDELSEQYDLYYRVHVAHIGWMDWASNNQVTGTLGYDYQIEAIQIQLVKKGEETPSPTKDIYREKPLQLWYSSHSESHGWMNSISNGGISGTVGEGKRLEAYKIEKVISSLTGDIYYKTYVEGIGWQDYVSSGDTSGTVGQSKRIEMVQMKLTDELSEQYDLYYRVHVAHIGWMDWASNNQVTGTLGYDYQIEAIQIQLVKKGEETPSPTKDIYRLNDLNVKYQSFVNGSWQKEVGSGEISGTVGKSLPIRAFKIQLENQNLNRLITYRSYNYSLGWNNYTTGGNISGDIMSDKKIEMIQIKLDDSVSDYYNVYYRVHVAHIGWLDWASNNQITGTLGYNYQIEAIEVKITKKEDNFDENMEKIYLQNDNYLTYSTHMESYGWMNSVYFNETSGVPASGKRMEAINIQINSKSINGGIKYSTHVENYGWMDWVEEGKIAGTVGEGKRLEAIKIELTGEFSNLYDIYYRAYVEDFGWLDWAKNGAIAGSLTISKRLEGIQIILVEKNGAAPGTTEQSYVDSIFRIIDGKKYYYSNGVAVTGFRTIQGIKYFFNSNGVLIADNVRKVIDVSSHQGKVNWSSVKSDGVDGVILRLGYGTSYVTDACVEDSYFSTNYNAVKNLSMLSGIYLYSYAIDEVSATKEAEFVLSKLKYYNVSKDVPFYYDLESNNWTRNLSIDDYDKIVNIFANLLEQNGYKVKIYTYKNLAENKFSSLVKNKLDWIAQYSDYCTYNGHYSGWQYTDNETIAGISGKVDVSVWLNRNN